jgi:signal transduction histidine kinase
LEALTLAVRNLGKGNLRQFVAIRASDEIGELASAFNTMSDRLARLEQARRNMVSDVAHELRTPLSCILGYLEALQDGVTSPTPDLIAPLYEEASLLRRLVMDLQELALAESGQLKLERHSILLPDLVEQAVSVFQRQAVHSSLVIHVDIPQDLPPIFADSERIGQVLRNLLKNAISYTPEQGLITICASAHNALIHVTVSDTGIGIEPEHLPYLFDRFYRTDRSRTQDMGGAGLGLAIVKYIVEAHGGHIWAESTPGKGAAFIFTLPTHQ